MLAYLAASMIGCFLVLQLMVRRVSKPQTPRQALYAWRLASLALLLGHFPILAMLGPSPSHFPIWLIKLVASNMLVLLGSYPAALFLRLALPEGTSDGIGLNQESP